MSINLQKGQKIALAKPDGGSLSRVMVGLGWDPVNRKKGLLNILAPNIDCDASAILLQNGKLAKNSDVVSFSHLTHKSGAVRHMGDNLTGKGDGDDEQIMVDLLRIPPEYDRITFITNIFMGKVKRQHFGQIANAYIRLVDLDTQGELMRYDLTGDYDGCLAMIFGDVYRHNGQWKFAAVGEGTKDGSIEAMCQRYR